MQAQVLSNVPSITRKLPGFDATGHLPVGIHASSLSEFGRLVRFNEHRQKMWLQLSSFLIDPVVKHRFCAVYFGGGFVSTKPLPSDIDLVLEATCPYGPDAFAAVAPFFVTGLDKIEMIYSVHLQFWMRDAPSKLTDYRTFFQYARPDTFKPAHDLSRGIVKIDLAEEGILSRLRRYIRGENTVAVPILLDPKPRTPADEIESLPGIKRRLALMAVNAPKLVVLTDAEGRIEWINDSFIHACGYSFEEMRGKKPGALLQGPATDRDTIQALHDAIATARHTECRLINYRKDGSAYIAHIMLSPLSENGKVVGFLGVAEDMGEPEGMTATQWAA